MNNREAVEQLLSHLRDVIASVERACDDARKTQTCVMTNLAVVEPALDLLNLFRDSTVRALEASETRSDTRAGGIMLVPAPPPPPPLPPIGAGSPIEAGSPADVVRAVLVAEIERQAEASSCDAPYLYGRGNYEGLLGIDGHVNMNDLALAAVAALPANAERFICLWGYKYYPSGGAEDDHAAFETADAAIAHARAQVPDADSLLWAHVFDVDADRVVFRRWVETGYSHDDQVRESTETE